MNTCYIYFTCDESKIDYIREFAREFFHQAHLRCTTERSYPESGWNTPAIGAPIEVWVTVRVPKELQLHDTTLPRIVQSFAASLNDRFERVENFSTEFL